MNYLNLHAHTNWSDGCDSIFNMTKAYQERDYVCSVITDHDYYFESSFGRTMCPSNASGIAGYTGANRPAKSIIDYFNECDRVFTQLQYPVISGMEISIGSSEEAVLFGREAILHWLLKKELPPKSDKYALIWVHPGNVLNKKDSWFSMFDMVEIVNAGQNFFTDGSYEYQKLCSYPLIQVRNLDAHAIEGWLRPHVFGSKVYPPIMDKDGAINLVDETVVIENELDLIYFIKNSTQKDWH